MRDKPAAIALRSLARLPLLLVLLGLEEPASLALLNNAGAHHLPPEPAEQPLLRFLVVHDHLDIVAGSEEHHIRMGKRRAHHRRDVGGARRRRLRFI